MPQGTQGIRNAVQDIETRKNSGGGGTGNWFKLDDGASAVVRFLEQGDQVHWAWCHDVQVEGQSYPMSFPCRDQDENGDHVGEACPGCEQRLGRKFKGWINLIWRDGPVYAREANGRLKKDGDGKYIVEGRADVLAVWNSGVTVFEELDGKDITYKGLSSRDFRITRRGTGMNTRYLIEPADPDSGPQPMSVSDKKLAEEKPDLAPEVTPMPYDQWGKKRKQQTEEGPRPVAADVSPFMSKK